MICRIIPRFDKSRCLYWRWYEVIQRPAMTSCQCQAISPHPKQLHPLARRTVPCRHQQWLRNKELGKHQVPIVGVRNEGEYIPIWVCLWEKIDDQPWNLGVLYHTVPECTSCSIKRMFFPWQSCVQGMFKRRSHKVCPVSPAVATVSAMTLAPATVTAARIQDGQIPRYQTCYRHIIN